MKEGPEAPHQARDWAGDFAMSLRFITEDWTLKLFSLGVAIVLFVFVTVESA